jgi:hypothetical protein
MSPAAKSAAGTKRIFHAIESCVQAISTISGRNRLDHLSVRAKHLSCSLVVTFEFSGSSF